MSIYAKKSVFKLLSFLIAIWMIPLFFEIGSLVRLAFEEMRVLIIGIVIGYFLGREARKNGS